MTTLRSAACRESTGMHLGRLNAFLAFLAQRLTHEDQAEAESLLHAAICTTHAARRNKTAAEIAGQATAYAPPPQAKRPD